MNSLLKRLRDEPVLLTTLVQASLTLGIVFGLDLSVEQNVSILGVTTALLAIFARSKVAPVKALEELAEAQTEITIYDERNDGHSLF